jgi:opine dehydrogenase
LVFIIVPSFAHDFFFNDLIPHLKDGHVVCVFAANSGALRFRELLRQGGSGKRIALYETANIPCGGRLIGPAKVRAFARNLGPWFGPKPRIHVEHHFVISALPGKETRGLQEIIDLYPAHERVKNVAVVALNSPHHLIHTPVVVLNTGRIEGIKEDFIILRDGQTPSVLRVEEAICEELEAMVHALGGTVTLSKKVPQNWKDIVTKFPIVFAKNTQAIEGKPGLRDRFVTEDAPYGLVPMTELARKLGVPTPIMDSFVLLASVINGEDYRKTGRNLKTLGLDQLDKEQILDILNQADLP